ncbi:MAG: zinc-dependent metalloprotease, partial [Chitinophagaceae bacterium]
SRARQMDALNAVLDCIDPGALQLPDQIVHLIPPRPAGYEFNRELFKKRTGLAFDALAPAETAVDLAFSFLFHPERLSRMAQEELKGGLGITEFLDRLIQATWKAPRQKGAHQLLQLQTEQVLLTYLLSSSVDDNLSFAARSSVVKALRDLKVFIELQQKQQPSTIYEAHLALALERIKTPEKAKPTLHMAIPPGAPIGCDWED